ncbi:hypothetical protein PFFVO_03108 [Plasmodium falciparum Vietnam Oak-Knoll (FVO)]|uniref:Surface antigen n=1 Tax=Plasmodium falciparum Vietnam Oak-Knoll (FVO) TaxID=1036723 RepID=A0A024V5Y9_PLAFA|nr:hypothetical protein PFFVO_03108 [Plasmodium falciparum Vietnam Oak-Knoll (FVO)]
MKEIMHDFDRQTSQRFEEYNERMNKNRQKCKEQCDRDIKNIILKDKLEKELMDKFATLQTDIQCDAIPICVCEKSLADKVEKGCLRCGYGLGTVAPTVGLIGALAVHAWKPLALKAAIAAALKANDAMISATAEAAGIEAGKIEVIESLKRLYVEYFWPEMSNYILEMSHYNEAANLMAVIHTHKYDACNVATDESFQTICTQFNIKFGISEADGVTNGLLPKDTVPNVLNGIVGQAEGPAKAAADAARETATAEITEKETAAINTIFMSKQTAIIASVVAIVVIVLIMIIIYLILRYRRKKKMKKKLQYIKLLKE